MTCTFTSSLPSVRRHRAHRCGVAVAAALATLLIVLMPSAATALPAPSRTGHESVRTLPDRAELQRSLDELVASGVPAVAVVVTRGAAVETYAAGETDGAPVTEHTVFRVESLSKSFTATAVMQLAERGRLDLDAPVVRYLPDLRIDDPRAGRITVRHLLNQSSGLTDATLGFDQYAPGPRTAAEAGVLLARSRLAFEPGTDWAYCNPHYWLLSWLVEEVSGTTLETYLTREVFTPLGMHDTRAAATAAQVGGAPGHSTVFGVAVPVSGPDAFVSGAGGAASSAHDLGRWLRFQHGRLPGTDAVSSPAARAETHRRQAPAGGLYALGWYSGPSADGGVERISHAGVGSGVGAYQGLFPDGLGVAVLMAAASPTPYSIAERVVGAETGSVPGELVTPEGPWRDIAATLVTLILVGLTCLGIARRARWQARAKRGRIAQVRSLVTLMLTAGAGISLLTVPWWIVHLVGRAAPWRLLVTTAPVPVIAALTCGIALLTLTFARVTVWMLATHTALPGGDGTRHSARR